jgi:serine/threonine protein kinase
VLPGADSPLVGAPGVSERHDRFARAFGPRYQFLRELGSGGMGHVYLCRDTVLERPVAIKTLKEERATAVACERFLREARTLAKLDHPHVVPVHDVGECEGILYFVMDFLDGQTLQEQLQAGARLTVRQVVDVGRQLLDTLTHVHGKGILHRDLKPANIFVIGGHVWLTDFGIAAEPTADGDTLTQTGQRLFTPGYVAPEQRDGRPLDGRADLYSLGLVLLEALTGDRPTTPDTSVWKRVPGQLAAVLQRAIANEPDDRWQDAAGFRQALERVIVDSGRSRSRRLALTSLAACAAVGAAWWVWLKLREIPPVPPKEDLAILPLEYRDDPHVGSDLTKYIVKTFLPFPRFSVQPQSMTRAWLLAKQGSPVTSPPDSVHHYAEGDVMRRGESLFVSLEIRKQNAEFVDQVTASGGVAQIDRLALAIADSLVAKLAPADLQAFRNIRHRPVQDPIAADSYFKGEEAFQRDDWVGAERAFSAALQRDPRFVQAAWGLMIARRFQRKPFGDVLMRLLGAAGELPPFYRSLLQAQSEPDLAERFRMHESIIHSAPSSGEALLHYTNERFHRGALAGRPLAATLDTMSQLAGEYRQLQHASTYDLTIWGNIRLGREKEAWQEFHRRKALVPRNDGYGLFHRYALWARFSPAKAWFMRTMLFRNADAQTLQALARLHRLGLTMDLPQTQVEIGGLLEQKDSSGPGRRTGIIGQALGLVAMGRATEGIATLGRADTASESDELALQRLEWPIMLSALGLPIDSVLVVQSRAALGRSAFSGAAAARARFALGLDALVHGDSALARRFAETLAGDQHPVSARLAALLDARLAAARGAHAEAIERSRIVQVLDTASYQAGPFARAATYLARGESQRALAQWALADLEWAWYENSDLMGWPDGDPQQGEVDAMLASYARLLRAELAIEHGDQAGPCASLQRISDLWRSSEASWSPLTERLDAAKERTQCH